jgi:hypothetical protein
LPNGKTQHWDQNVSQCHDATELLRGYWGLGTVEEAGCRYEAVKVSTNQFRITSKCMVRHASVAKSEATVVVEDTGELAMTIVVHEGKRTYRGSQRAHRQSACPSSPQVR